MKVLQTLMWVSGVTLVLAGMLGCDVFVQRSHRDVVYVDQQPDYVIVQEAPPPFIVERRPPMPGSGYVWIDGYQHWNGQRYVWQSGQWARPPHEKAVWVAPRYDKHDKGGYRYTPGHWQEQR